MITCAFGTTYIAFIKSDFTCIFTGKLEKWVASSMEQAAVTDGKETAYRSSYRQRKESP